MLALPAAAEAQRSQRTDPAASSPAGAIYQIPLDDARRDAAPAAGRAGGGGDGGSGESGGGSGSGGSPGTTGGSATGASGGDGGGDGVAGSSEPDATAGGDRPSSIKSENGFGSSAKVPGVDGIAPLPSGEARDGGSFGGATTPLLLTLIAAASVGVGVTLSRHVRH